MSKVTKVTIVLIALFTVWGIQAHAQTPAPAAKPAIDAEKYAIDFTDRMDALSKWYLTYDGKEDGLQQAIDHMMELFAPDVIAEVPPHDDKQMGPVMLM